jgi:hypothetical protein
MMLIYDHEYREEHADFEPCMPIRGGKAADGIEIRELPGGRASRCCTKAPTTNWAAPTPRCSTA